MMKGGQIHSAVGFEEGRDKRQFLRSAVGFQEERDQFRSVLEKGVVFVCLRRVR